MPDDKKPKPGANIFEDVFGDWVSGSGLGQLFTPPVIACPVCGVKNRLKLGGAFPKCGRCKTRLT